MSNTHQRFEIAASLNHPIPTKILADADGYRLNGVFLKFIQVLTAENGDLSLKAEISLHPRKNNS